MKLSETAMIILSATAAREDRIVMHRKASAPVAELTCCRSLVTKGMLETIDAPLGTLDLVTTQGEDGTLAFRITDAGLREVGVEPEAPPTPEPAPQPAPSARKGRKGAAAAKPSPAPPAGDSVAQVAPRLTLRQAAAAVVAAYDGDDDALTYQATLTASMDALRARLVAKPEGGEKSGGRAMTPAQRILVDLCLRTQGASAKELAEGAGWPSIAARSTMQKIAGRFGYTLTEKAKTDKRGITFYLHAAPPLAG